MPTAVCYCGLSQKQKAVDLQHCSLKKTEPLCLFKCSLSLKLNGEKHRAENGVAFSNNMQLTWIQQKTRGAPETQLSAKKIEHRTMTHFVQDITAYVFTCTYHVAGWSVARAAELKETRHKENTTIQGQQTGLKREEWEQMWHKTRFYTCNSPSSHVATVSVSLTTAPNKLRFDFLFLSN